MKMFLALLHCWLVCNLFAQNGPPTANDIRKGIAGEIYGFHIAPQPIYKVENKAVWNGTDSIKVRLYYPKAGKGQRIIYNIHGGALIAGDLDTHDNICRLLANRTGSIVVAVDYRKPPEYPYPAGLTDCSSVLHWIHTTAATWGGDANKLVLLGDSGGGLFVTALQVKEQGEIPIEKVVLINPAVDLRTPGEDLYGLVTQLYLHGHTANDSLVSPILATQVSIFPPTLLISCEKDLLKSHSDSLYAKLQQAHVPARLVTIPGKDHLGGYWAAAHSEAEPAISKTVSFILDGSKK